MSRRKQANPKSFKLADDLKLKETLATVAAETKKTVELIQADTIKEEIKTELTNKSIQSTSSRLIFFTFF